jgi:hypothetical protein
MRSFLENHFVQPFDWAEWQSTAVKLFNEPERLSKATLKTCVKLITLHVSKDRFVGGHFGEMVPPAISPRSLEGWQSYGSRWRRTRVLSNRLRLD